MTMDMIRYGGLLFLVSLSGIWGAVVQLDPATKVLLHRNARSASCVVNGNTYADGSTFTIVGSGYCTTYSCTNGNHNVLSYSCELSGQCVAINSTLDVSCSTYTCTSTTSNGVTQLKIAPTTPRCTYNGQCYGDTASVVINCVTRTCNVQTLSNGTILNSMQISSVQCQDDNGACHDSGQRLTKTFSGSTYNCKCTVTGTSTSFSECTSA